MAYDLLILGGVLVDPAAGLHEALDVAFKGNRVAAVAPNLSEASATTIVEADGRYVTPG